MSARRAGLWILLAASAAGVASAAAQPESPGVTLTLRPPSRITVGDRSAVVAELHLEAAGDAPVLLTPTSEGTAVEVVRGRLLRSDAERPDAPVLRFHIPIVARSVGTSVLRLRVQSFACTQRCRPIEAEASTVLRVRAPAPDREEPE